MIRLAAFSFLSLLSSSVLACDGCYGEPVHDVVLTRNVPRMQPDAESATSKPRGPLAWGQLNFLHTTDTHGWLEGHLKEQNYGADWGDFVSFVKAMRTKAKKLDVDLLLIDTGDLHDGAGLSDATSPNGAVSNPIFENIDYDLLTIGNHELYVTEIAYEHFNQFAKVYGDRYLTSNVQIINPATGQFEYIGKQYRYFTTEHGVRIMAFGVLYDFTGNSNVSKVITAAELVKEQWFLNAVNYHKPIDLFLVIGHNPIRANVSGSTFGTLFSTIRELRPDTPIQGFGGHTHIRDFTVFDNKATGLESGRYCETLGWLSLSGLSHFKGCKNPEGVPNPKTKAVPLPQTGNNTLPQSKSPSSLRYFRRYLDWNRLTFAYHAEGSQDRTFDTPKGKAATADITSERKKLNLTALYGCAPDTYCQYCKPFLADGNIFKLLAEALSTVVVNQTRADNARMIIINTGSVRFDLAKGPFTYDDSFIVSPFTDSFQFIPDVPYEYAVQVLPILNAGAFQRKRRDLSTEDFGFQPMSLLDRDVCLDPPLVHDHIHARDFGTKRGRLIRRQSTAPTPGYTTTDDFGTDGDDTVHSKIPYYNQPNDLQANASFPTDGSNPATVDLVFLDFIQSYILNALHQAGATNYSSSDVSYYLPTNFTTNSYLPAYAKIAWQANVPNCPVGTGIGSS